MNKINTIDSAGTLGALCEILNSIEDLDDAGIDLSELPTFGGRDGPLDTMGVYSWDNESILVVNSGLNEWGVVARCTCGEAEFNCDCWDM